MRLGHSETCGFHSRFRLGRETSRCFFDKHHLSEGPSSKTLHKWLDSLETNGYGGPPKSETHIFFETLETQVSDRQIVGVRGADDISKCFYMFLLQELDSQVLREKVKQNGAHTQTHLFFHNYIPMTEIRETFMELFLDLTFSRYNFLHA